MALAIRFSSSSVSTRSEFQIIERSVTLMSASSPQIADMRLQPASSDSWVRNTAASSCMARCIFSRSTAVGVPPLAWRSRSKRSMIFSTGRFVDRRDRRGAVDDLAGADRGGAAEDDEVDQRVGAEAVGAVHRGAAGFADGHQAGRDAVGIVGGRVQHLAPVVRRNAAHVVVHGRQHRDRLARHVDAGEDLGRSPRCRAGARAAPPDRDGRDAGRCGPCSCRRRGPRGFPASCSARRRRARQGPWPTARSAP